MPTAEELNDRLDHMIAFVNESREQIQNGTLANLGQLDEDVARICDEVEAAPPDVAQQVSDKMSEMISALEELARSLKTFQDEAEENKQDGDSENA